MFGHELFKPYQLSLRFLTEAMALLDQLPKGSSYLHDQLKRAASSISLNLAEGAGKMTNADKLRFYSIARGSAMECAAICDVISLVEPQLAARAREAKELLEEMTRILTSVCGGGKAEAENKAKTKIEAKAEAKAENKTKAKI